MAKSKLQQPPPIELVIKQDPEESAREAGLRYVDDGKAGFTRERRGEGFVYFDKNGQEIADENHLKRIRALAIPPAWSHVWICPQANGHIQATGRDVRGRKQYRYHARWVAARDEVKFNRTIQFAQALPHIRARVEQDLKRPGLPREKVLAAVVKMLEVTLIRIGNEEYAKENKTYGLTTLRNKHVGVSGQKITFNFKGKSGVQKKGTLTDRRLAAIVKKCQELPGQQLFTYLDKDGAAVPVSSDEVNQYIREIAGQEFTAKDFRTWAATVFAMMALQEFELCDSQSAAKKNVVRAVEDVAKRLGNTPSVCRKCYVHPAVLESYLDGSLVQAVKEKAEEELAHPEGLRPEEIRALEFLRRRLVKASAEAA